MQIMNVKTKLKCSFINILLVPESEVKYFFYEPEKNVKAKET